jgi:3-deoxy-manno-octulosonate cytidylyltransferase (CMP-KDO synthetase)
VPRKILGVIPARFASSRFPGKVLALIASKSMLQRVYERASLARYLTATIIATDDERVYEVARSFGARVVMTRPDHVSGTDRVAEAASAENAELVVNIQGDEPLIDPAAIDAAILPLAHDPGIVMGTLKKAIEDPREITDANVVKVVTDRNGDAIYFSRCPIPYMRDGLVGRSPGTARDARVPLPDAEAGASARARAPAPHHIAGDVRLSERDVHFKHIGLYVYRRDFLLGYSALPVGPLEQAERLEQLRAIENGYRIRVVETEFESLGVDTPEDLERVRKLFEASMAREVRQYG